MQESKEVLFPAIAQAAESIIAEPSQMSYMPFTLWVLVTGISLEAGCPTPRAGTPSLRFEEAADGVCPD